MKLLRFFLQIVVVAQIASLAVVAQTGSDKQFAKDGLTFDYSPGWTLQDDKTDDAQQ